MPRNKKKTKLTVKQAKLVKALTKVDSVAAAGREVGYETKQAAHQALNRIREKAPAILDRLGFNRDKVFGKIGSLMEAKETKFFANAGIVMDTRVVDNPELQLRAAVELGKMHGAYPKGSDGGEQADTNAGGITINLGVFNDPAARAFFASVQGDNRPPLLVDALHKDG